jgi:hypothetical protein
VLLLLLLLWLWLWLLLWPAWQRQQVPPRGGLALLLLLLLLLLLCWRHALPAPGAAVRRLQQLLQLLPRVLQGSLQLLLACAQLQRMQDTQHSTTRHVQNAARVSGG